MNNSVLPVVDVHEVCVSFGDRKVVKNVSFQVNSGEFVGLLGPNGAGKTTLFRTIMGLRNPTSGKVTISSDGTNANWGDKSTRMRKRMSSRIGYVPQRHDVAWDFPISVLDVVMMGRIRHIGYIKRPRIEDYKAALIALDRVQMADFKDRVIGELSGGQRQRVLVARALASHPHVLLLDEPFTGLDMPSQELLTHLFHGLTSEGESIIMSSHDIVGSIHSCSRLILFNGQIVADTTPQDITAAQWAQTFRISEQAPLIQLISKVDTHA